MKKIFFLFSLASMLSGIANAQNTNAPLSFSLQQAIEYAYQHQKDVLNAQLDEQIADAKVKETRGIGLPQISANFDVKDYYALNFLLPGAFAGGEPESFVGFPLRTPSYSASGAVQASQLLFDGSFFAGLKASKAYREYSQKNLTRTRIETAVGVSKAYFYALVTNERFQLMEANVNRVRKLKDDTKALYDNGFVEKIDYDRVVLTYNNLATEKGNVARLMKLSEFMLNFQMGLDIETKIILTDSLNEDRIKNYQVSAEKNDATMRIEYSLLQTQQNLYQMDLKRYRSQYYPSLSLYGSLSTIQQDSRFKVFESDAKWYPTGFVGLQLNWSLFDGLQREKKVDQAKLELKKIDNEIVNVTNSLNVEAESSRTLLINALATYNTQLENLELGNEVVRVSKAKYDQGVGSNLEVIDAETSLKEAQTNYYNSLYEALVAKVELDKALGKIK